MRKWARAICRHTKRYKQQKTGFVRLQLFGSQHLETDEIGKREEEEEAEVTEMIIIITFYVRASDRFSLHDTMNSSSLHSTHTDGRQSETEHPVHDVIWCNRISFLYLFMHRVMMIIPVRQHSTYASV